MVSLSRLTFRRSTRSRQACASSVCLPTLEKPLTLIAGYFDVLRKSWETLVESVAPAGDALHLGVSVKLL